MGNVLKDIGNFVSNPTKQINNGVKGLGISNLAHDVEQGLSGGEGWGGLGKNVAGVVAAPLTGGTSLAGTQWAENAMQGKDILGSQKPLQDEPKAQASGVDGNDPLHQLEQAVSGGNGIGGALDNAGKLASAVAPVVGDYLGSQASADVARRAQDMQAKAYQEMLGRSKEGEQQFLKANNEVNPSLDAYAKSLQDLGTQNIGRQQNIINQQLGRAGVRGGQAANLYGRQIGELQNNGMRDINKLAYEDAQNRANQKSQYFANKGQSGFNLVPKYS